VAGALAAGQKGPSESLAPDRTPSIEQVEQISALEEKLRVAKRRASVEEKNTADAFQTAQQATAMLEKVNAKKLKLKAAVSRQWYCLV
jgi:hypothetical protein